MEYPMYELGDAELAVLAGGDGGELGPYDPSVDNSGNDNPMKGRSIWDNWDEYVERTKAP